MTEIIKMMYSIVTAFFSWLKLTGIRSNITMNYLSLRKLPLDHW